jgi:hypothetical protein
LEESNMKRSQLSVIAVLILGALPLSCGGSSSGSDPSDEPGGTAVEALCAKSAKCMLLEDLTEQECVTQNQGTLDALRKFPECTELVSVNEQSYMCASALACDQLSAFLDDANGTHMCNQVVNALPDDKSTACRNAAHSQ